MTQTVSLPPYEITLFSDEPHSDGIIYLHSGKDEAADVFALLKAPKPTLVSVDGTDWERDFSPWQAEKAFKGGVDFSGGADAYIKTLTEIIVPETEKHLDAPVKNRMLAGYSLAGLFAVYCAYKTAAFTHIASVSGSLWYDGFADFMRTNRINSSVTGAYFSVGDREKHTKNARMKTVQDDTQAAAGIFKAARREVVFELNSGGHFDCAAERIAKAAVIM